MDFSQVYSQYDFSKLEQEIQQLFPDWDLKFQDLFLSVLQGNGYESLKSACNVFIDCLKNEMNGMKSVFVTILLIGIISAVFISLTGIFENHQVADYGFYFTYLILIIFLIKIFSEVFTITQGVLENIVAFMKIFLPTYFLTIGAAGGTTAAIGYYQIFMLAVFGVESLLAGVLVPLIGSYMILNIANGIWEEEKLELLTQMISKSVRTILKILITVVSGTGLLQAMIAPVIDTAKMTVMQKSITAIPGLGELAGSAAQVLLGSAVLIKNAMGVILLILLCAVCIIPLVKLFSIMAMLKGAAAIMGMVADKRMTNCANRAGDGVLLLFQTTLTALTFFVILVSIIAFTMNRGF